MNLTKGDKLFLVGLFMLALFSISGLLSLTLFQEVTLVSCIVPFTLFMFGALGMCLAFLGLEKNSKGSVNVVGKKEKMKNENNY